MAVMAGAVLTGMAVLAINARMQQEQREHWNTLVHLKRLDISWSDPATCLKNFGKITKSDLKKEITELSPVPGSKFTSENPLFIRGTYKRDANYPHLATFESTWKQGERTWKQVLPLSLVFEDVSGEMISCSTLPALQEVATCPMPPPIVPPPIVVIPSATPSSPSSPSPTPSTVPGDAQTICTANPQVTFTQTINFPKYDDGCDFGKNGNLKDKDGYQTARHESTVKISGVPASATVCEVVFTLPSQKVSMDDFFYLNFDGIILATSFAKATTLMPASNGLYPYDWKKVAGTGHGGNAGQYCLGKTEGLGTCVMPGNSATSAGPATVNGILQFDSSLFYRIADIRNKAAGHTFTLVTTGDDDDDDCYNSKFSFTVTMKYVP